MQLDFKLSPLPQIRPVWVKATLNSASLEKLVETSFAFNSPRRRLKALTQRLGLTDETRRVIKDHFGPDHFSLDFIKFSREEYIQINDKKQGQVADRNESVQFLDNPDEIVAKAVRLLKSPEWRDKAAELSVFTGRRSSEILSQIEKVFKEGAQELTDHHQKHQLDPVKHNLRHRRKRQISDMSQLEDVAMF